MVSLLVSDGKLKHPTVALDMAPGSGSALMLGDSDWRRYDNKSVSVLPVHDTAFAGWEMKVNKTLTGHNNGVVLLDQTQASSPMIITFCMS